MEIGLKTYSKPWEFVEKSRFHFEYFFTKIPNEFSLKRPPSNNLMEYVKRRSISIQNKLHFFVLIVQTGLLLLRQLYGPIFGKLSLQFFMDLFDPE